MTMETEALNKNSLVWRLAAAFLVIYIAVNGVILWYAAEVSTGHETESHDATEPDASTIASGDGTPSSAQVAATSLFLKKVPGTIPVDPNHAIWLESIPYKVELVPQQVALPMGGGAVKVVIVRGLYNRSQVAYHLTWSDGSEDFENGVDSYKDAVAIQFPVTADANPSPQMGDLDNPVNIWHWRADWQADADGTDILDLRQPLTDGVFVSDADSRVLKAEFPARPDASMAAVEYNAVGYRTLHKQDLQDVKAKGIYQNGGWSVVMVRNLVSVDAKDAEFPPGTPTAINFAVWDGRAGDVNGMKSVSLTWHKLELEAPKVETPPEIVALYVDVELDIDPSSSLWRACEPAHVPLLPQTTTIPNGGGSVWEVMVRAMHNRDQIAFHLEWNDDTEDMENGVDSYKDAVALEFPVTYTEPLPSPLMGDKDKPVNIWHWRADWQADLDGRRSRFIANRQPIADGIQFFHTETTLIERWHPEKRDPSLSAVEYSAEGWGTLTMQEAQHVEAQGVYHNGKWGVVFKRDLKAAEKSDVGFSAGGPSAVNFAVWNGSKGEVNGMKSVTLVWIPLTIEPTP